MDNKKICHCMDVTESEIIDAIKKHGATVEAVMANTNAGTGCGACVPKIKEIISENE